MRQSSEQPCLFKSLSQVIARHAPLQLPRTTAIGDIIAYANEKMETKEGMRNRYTFAGAEYFDHMKEVGRYTLDVNEIEERIEKAGLKDVFKRKLV